MSERILFVSQYVEPNLFGGNNNVYRQARALKQGLGIDVEILTWPAGDEWRGPVPDEASLGEIPSLNWAYEGVNYHVVKLPEEWLGRVLEESAWERAVETGCELLQTISPDIVHLQHWRGLWWILESANRLSIPTVYTPHDWGLGCLRTILTKGEGGLCDGVVAFDKCCNCIWQGRNLVGKLNEMVVSSAIGESLMNALWKSPMKQFLSRHGSVQLGLQKRFNLNHNRARKVLNGLSALIVPNEFGKRFFLQFGIDKNRIFVEPWYYDMSRAIVFSRVHPEKSVLGFIGRISQEKGVERIFEALSSNLIQEPIHFVIAGEIQGTYATRLHERFSQRVGKHSVEWIGFIPHDEIHRFYEHVDVVLISSECIENGPLTLVEAFSYKRPVIMSDTPTARNYVEDGRTGFLYKHDNTNSLIDAIRKAISNPEKLLEMRDNMPVFKSSAEYAKAVALIYDSIKREQTDSGIA